MPYQDEDHEDDGDDGLPDAAFTELELSAGVQHIVRTGNPNATHSGRASQRSASDFDLDDVYSERARLELLARIGLGNRLHFDTFEQARAWAQAGAGRSFSRALGGAGFDAKAEPPKGNGVPSSANPPALGRDRTSLRKRIPYPSENPAIATWFPGDYARTEAEWQLAWIDVYNRRHVFEANLRRLSPAIAASVARDYNDTGLGNVMSSTFHRKQSRHDLYQLLTLLEDELERRMLYHTQDRPGYAAYRKRVETGQLPDSQSYWQGERYAIEQTKGRIPRSDLFLLYAIELVMTELVDRE